MRLTGRQARSGEAGKIPSFCRSAAGLIGWLVIAGASPADASELSSAQAALYSTVSIFPPSAQRMTVCYGFVCRRREILDFSAGDRNALTRILAAGHASAAAERAAVQKAVIWFDRRMGPVLGTNKRVAKADFRAGDDKPQLRLLGYYPQHHQPVARAAAMGPVQISCGGRPALPRQCAGAADAAQHRRAGRSRDRCRMGRGPVAAGLFAAAGCHDGGKMGDGRLNGRAGRAARGACSTFWRRRNQNEKFRSFRSACPAAAGRDRHLPVTARVLAREFRISTI